MATLKDLSSILRDKSKWPEGFKWNYSHPKTCAMGLANRVFGWHHSHIHSAFVAEKFGMDPLDARNIFCCLAQWAVYRMAKMDWTPSNWNFAHREAEEQVTPEMVADAIDAYLVRSES